ncbi:hypothetical protein GGD63_003353 [Bradyrhizobium sp. cir1]|uniref:hypothetical protein n=1 Tax=Bradyrhizobium sp. cir1 TaxID=1445730 RepID=UPI001606B09F|nr:hypothetical protein [Bradyrhizobium sp. cir1]MBB4370558.1 hypothetical protein [Bradyrhizobium sp. cir1]
MTAEKLRSHVTYLSELGPDAEGRDVFVGLTYGETVWLIEYRERRARGEPGWSRDQAAARELAARHHTAHIEIVIAQAEKRFDNPTIN